MSGYGVRRRDWSAGTRTRPPSLWWTTAPAASRSTPCGTANNAKIDDFLDADPEHRRNPDDDPERPRVPVLLDVQVCFKYGSTDQCTWSQTPNTTVQRRAACLRQRFPDLGGRPRPGRAVDRRVQRGRHRRLGARLYRRPVDLPLALDVLDPDQRHRRRRSVRGWIAQFDGADAGAAGMAGDRLDPHRRHHRAGRRRRHLAWSISSPTAQAAYDG